MSVALSLFIFWMLSLSSFISAQTVELDSIEIHADKNISDKSFIQREHFNEERLDSASTLLVADLLSEVQGIQSVSSGGPGGRISFFVRGTEARHTAFVLDGLKLNDPSNVDRQFDAAFLTSSFLKEMTFHKGPQAVLFGSDALGGLVEFISRKGEHAPQSRFSIRAGSFGTSELGFSKDWKVQAGQGTLSISRFYTEGISRLNKKRFNAKEADQTESLQLTSSSLHQLSPRWQAKILASYLSSQAEQDRFVSSPVEADAKDDVSKNNQMIFQIQNSYKKNKSMTYSIRNGASLHSRRIDQGIIPTETFDGGLYQNEFLSIFNEGDFGITTGGINEIEKFQTKQSKNDIELNSVYTQARKKIHDINFLAGTRFDHHSQFGSFLTSSFGIGKDFSSNQELKFQWSQGLKAPTLYQLYAPEIFSLPVGNPYLKPERSDSFELSWLLKGSFSQVRLTLFNNHLKNLIVFTNSGYLNQGYFITSGAEAGISAMKDQFMMDFYVSHQGFEQNKTKVLRRPYNQFNFKISYTPIQTIELSFKTQWQDSRLDRNINSEYVKLNSYFVSDLGFRKIYGSHEWGGDLKNVFNETYEQIYGYSVLPRSLFVYYGHKFN